MTGRFLDKTTRPTATVEPAGPVADVREGRAVVTDIGDNKITPLAEGIRYASDEQMVWQERPSPLTLLPRAIGDAALLIVVVIALSYLGSVLGAGRRVDASAVRALSAPASFARTWFWRIELLLFAVLAIRLALAYVSLAAVKYRATSQRLFVESGVFITKSVPYEIYALGDAVVSGNIFLKLFKISNLTILEPTTIELVGLRNADYVRDILRSGGQLEAQRADKIRWR